MKRSLIWIPRAVGVAVIIAVTAIVMWHSARPVIPPAHAALANEGAMPELTGAVGWLNSTPLSRDSLRGKVVLVNFWTYSCINSLRELPYIKSWAAKYKGAGLVVVGAHAPEFGFEKERANVENAVRELKITFPVPIDSDHRIWNAFQMRWSLSIGTGKVIFNSRTAFSTFARSFSNPNSGACAPTTTRPASLYFAAQLLM